MNVIETMNYNYNSRLNNPDGKLFPVDSVITQSFANMPRTKEQIEQFGLWLSMSPENKDKSLNQMLENVEVLENTHAKTM